MLQVAIGIISVSAIVVFASFEYTQQHPIGLFGGDPTLKMAGFGMVIGQACFFIGIGLLIGTLVAKQQIKSRVR